MNMIFPSLYEELDMQRYAGLAANILPDSKVKTALCDDSGQIIWASNGKKKQAELIVHCHQQQCTDRASDGEQRVNSETVINCNLGELSGLPAGQLVFYGIAQSVSEEIVSALHSIAEIVKAELGYLYEVNAMASELGERYDELSMLRASDLALTEYRESRHILSTYIRSCSEHLNVKYAAIWIPERHTIYPGGLAYEHDSTEILSLLESLSVVSYAMFQKGNDGFGINDKDKALRDQIQLPANMKVLIVPILDAAAKPCGVLSCLNESTDKDFNNSDKSTLEAVSRKTYKYLLSTQDELTGLLNRKGFEESVWREISQTDSERHLVLFNINQFKVINAAYGITTGDMVLAALAKVLSKAMHQLRFTARLDADVFAALLEVSKDEVEALVKNICNDIDSMKTTVNGKALSVESRAGVIALNSKETALADHIYAAEMALLSAKEDSSQVIVYKPGNTALLKRTNQLTQVENIKHALEEDRFELYCQSIEPLSGNQTHYEILVRMIDVDGELVFPDDFIPVAERYNLMNMVDRWIIEHTFELLGREEYRDISAKFKWGINLSGMTISDPDFHDFVSQCLHQYQFEPTNLYFEITETAAIKNFQNCVSFMNKIHSLGVQFALDDFGSGLSSFSYLKNLSIDYLKIDGSLIRDIVSSRLDQVMVSSIADIAKELNVKTIAEYVENASILEVLINMNIDFAQGYQIMKPKPVTQELKSLAEYSQYKLSSGN
jgi:diguanylate cyclase (GGDEF)-like protein